MDATPENANGVGAEKNRIRTGPIPEWVGQCTCDFAFKDQPDAHLTHLLFDRQVHAERREIFFHAAIRLETRAAVERHSQWHLEFEPQPQSHVWHFLRLRRDGVTVEQLRLEKGHRLQREEGLERLVISGWFTFQQILEDVRPGDILEWAYTTEYTPAILPEYFVSFFTLPEWVVIGTYHFTACFNPARRMQWKTSAPELKPEESQARGLTVWKWSAEKYAGRKREPHRPAWYLATPWIQISDCPDWQAVAMAVAQAWAKPDAGQKLRQQSAWILDLPLGYAELRDTRGLGELPESPRTPPAASPPETIGAKATPAPGPGVNPLPNAGVADSPGAAPVSTKPSRNTSSSRRRRHKPKPDFGGTPLWVKIISGLLALLGIILIIIVLSHGSGVSQWRVKAR